jgi:hypothetical protein
MTATQASGFTASFLNSTPLHFTYRLLGNVHIDKMYMSMSRLECNFNGSKFTFADTRLPSALCPLPSALCLSIREALCILGHVRVKACRSYWPNRKSKRHVATIGLIERVKGMSQLLAYQKACRSCWPMSQLLAYQSPVYQSPMSPISKMITLHFVFSRRRESHNALLA